MENKKRNKICHRYQDSKISDDVIGAETGKISHKKGSTKRRRRRQPNTKLVMRGKSEDFPIQNDQSVSPCSLLSGLSNIRILNLEHRNIRCPR
ncbi:hypothetical protein AVEN_111474-1 [Araneus ventricosus]|uniref:Uncharacterized protein n=1 Tax=Araneus ventricosus TaxID=182803 RepID=A0A4Y2Q1Z4_ARAVE|nr:hypothetical protein AVEN_111474-1 [Araneus ventricosus]